MDLTHVDVEEVAPIWNQVMVGGLHATPRGASMVRRHVPLWRLLYDRKMDLILNLIFDAGRRCWY